MELMARYQRGDTEKSIFTWIQGRGIDETRLGEAYDRLDKNRKVPQELLPLVLIPNPEQQAAVYLKMLDDAPSHAKRQALMRAVVDWSGSNSIRFQAALEHMGRIDTLSPEPVVINPPEAPIERAQP